MSARTTCGRRSISAAVSFFRIRGKFWSPAPSTIREKKYTVQTTVKIYFSGQLQQTIQAEDSPELPQEETALLGRASRREISRLVRKLVSGGLSYFQLPRRAATSRRSILKSGERRINNRIIRAIVRKLVLLFLNYRFVTWWSSYDCIDVLGDGETGGEPR